MRPSSIANRSLYANPQTNSQATLLKLNEKKKEYEAVAALERTSSAFLERILGLADDCDVMAMAGEVHGQVSEQWPRMFHILSLFLNARGSSEDQADSTSQGEMLVRIPIEDAIESNAAANTSE
ncbi:hypothetical protein EV361DRAFT_792383 [Lentinula raphanica]|uniref:DASH complex subunit DAD2 n=1 Tax=Lentinula raphanica TaxID=153919 RepID=A0AA38PG37_9AGAR|nr:hypothetical protein EV360DRAFT_37040 [Lentinula raphanica]KAJ3842096.1 hypothetical protein F5878DRAFT_530434 [Lentinula raphanica]KAJ3975415.1 hypothetical protein EV361DRAFT_792383 [Lentinula raphanica]